jgi:ribulose 1,5-bisphosphate synthetase/thiazole synthase
MVAQAEAPNSINGVEEAVFARRPTEILPTDGVLIIGAGPVGLCVARVLAEYGVKSIILERNETTTK